MTSNIHQLIESAQAAAAQKNWSAVENLASQIVQADANNTDGYYLRATSHRMNQKVFDAIDDYQSALLLSPNRYDIAVELASMHSSARQNADAARILGEYESSLNESPRYLDLAGTIYTEVGMAHKAWPLFNKANELQPNVDFFQANLATCAVFLGKVKEAKEVYLGLLERFPEHRKNHYQLSRLAKATDYKHIDQMKAILAASKENVDRDVPLYFAIAKELEDLEQWDECFDYYRQACEAVLGITQYSSDEDVAMINTIINTFNQDWLEQGARESNKTDVDTLVNEQEKTPIFIVGLPRTGTTLLERIVSSHSKVSSVGETLFLQMGIRRLSGVPGRSNLNQEVVRAIATKNPDELRQHYMHKIGYRLGDEPMFIEKLPLNFLYLGLIAKAWPNAKIIHMVRNPMDACFSMYKQVFTWAYKYSYSPKHLGEYYVAYNKLREHWNAVLGDRIVEVHYEDLIHDQEQQTRNILDKLGLGFEENCLQFEKNTAPSATASSVQVRSKVHSGSIGKWRRFEQQLAPLREHLESNGIDVSST